MSSASIDYLTTFNKCKWNANNDISPILPHLSCWSVLSTHGWAGLDLLSFRCWEMIAITCDKYIVFDFHDIASHALSQHPTYFNFLNIISYTAISTFLYTDIHKRAFLYFTIRVFLLWRIIYIIMEMFYHSSLKRCTEMTPNFWTMKL